MTTDIITPPLAPEQGTSLTVVSDTLAELQKVKAGLADLAKRFSGVVYDVQTTKGMEQAKADRLEVREVRYTVQRAAKSAKDTLNEQKKLIDQKADYIVGEITKIEVPIDAQIKAEEDRKAAEKAAREKAERERIEAIAKKLADIRARSVVLPGTKATDINAIGDALLAAIPTEEEFGDMLSAALRAFDETMASLKAHYQAALAHEEQQRILAQQKAELEAQQAAARAEAKRLEEQRKAEQMAAEAQRKQREAEQEAFAAKVREFERQQAEAAAALERERAEAEADIARQRAEWEARIAPVAPVLSDKAVADANARSWVDTFAPDNGVCGSRPLVDPAPVVEIVLEAAPAAPVPEEKATLKLGEIQRLLGLPIPSLLLATLGHPAADIPGTSAKLYKPSEFGRICRSLIVHIGEVADKFEG